VIDAAHVKLGDIDELLEELHKQTGSAITGMVLCLSCTLSCACLVLVLYLSCVCLGLVVSCLVLLFSCLVVWLSRLAVVLC
jgi:hypothetical protein